MADGGFVCYEGRIINKACGFRSTASGFIDEALSARITVYAYITTAFRFRQKVSGVIPYV